MACFYPRQALRLVDQFTRSGKSVVRFISRSQEGLYSDDLRLLTGLPCGQCIGCRLERSRQWAIRMMNEAQLHDQNCFITLTFDEEHLAKREVPMSLDKSDFKKFMKRLRKRMVKDYFLTKLVKYMPRFARKFLMRFASKRVAKLRYYMCGEYGELLRRPHYHAILFGLDFPDKKLERIQDGKRYYVSAMLKELWPFGYHLITDVTFDTCAYVARYIMKKSLGKDAWKNYFEYIDLNSGELFGHRLPEYTTMSRRSGIGKAWLAKYLQDVYPKDKIFMRGRGFSKPPKYYDTLYELVDPSDFSRMKQARVDAAVSRSDDNTPSRLEAKRLVKIAQIGVLKRNLE